MRGTRRRRAGSTGFTLIELLVVIAVIILLMAILLPVLQRSASHAREVQCLANVRQLGAAFVAYSGNYKGFLPSPAHRDDINEGDHNNENYFDGDTDFPDTDRPPYTWKGKILNYIGTASDNPDEKYQVYKCPAVRLFKNHKSFYGTNAYITMHVKPEQTFRDTYPKMAHFDDIEQTSKTLMIGENDDGHWAVKPKHPRDSADFSATGTDEDTGETVPNPGGLYARHLRRSAWVFADGQARSMRIADAEEDRCLLWVANKEKHRRDYGD